MWLFAYGLCIPWWENVCIFGAKWLIKEWKTSRWDVSRSGDGMTMSFFICLELRMGSNFLFTFVPTIKKTIKRFKLKRYEYIQNNPYLSYR